LKTITDPPPVLYLKGSLIPEEAAVAIVGTRAATPYGCAVAHRLGQELARLGITVVSGLAEGIDAAGHRGALEAGGRTIAVLGHGLDFLYPQHHRKLADVVVNSGALISEFPMEVPPTRQNFPRRNRVISGLSLGVVVVEAPQASGALITAREALDQGREVFAVPGPVSSPKSKGCHQLLKDGARLVEDIHDVVDELAPHLKERLARWKEALARSGSPRTPCFAERSMGGPPVRSGEPDRSETPVSPEGLSDEESVVYESIPTGRATVVDALIQSTAFPPARLLTLLTDLELKGLVQQVPGQGFSRV
jgi:DNA processing protein